MLVLSRNENQRIVLSGGIVITVVRAQGGKARIGIDAPQHVVVDREEIAERKKAEDDNRTAGQARASGEARNGELTGASGVGPHEGSVPQPEIPTV